MEETIAAAGGIGAAAYVGKVFAERICDAIGGALLPGHIKRLAQAEAEAALIRAHNETQVADIQNRAALRHIEEQIIHQRHIEAISKQASTLLKPTAKPHLMDRDWISYFFSKARLVGETDMQNLWAKILAGEANSPGAFSKRTLSIVSDLEKIDAEIFLELCSLSLTGTETLIPIIPFDAQEWIGQHKLRHLAYLGLIIIRDQGFNHQLASDVAEVSYAGRTIIVTPVDPLSNGKPNRLLPVGRVTMTLAGTQLAKICTPQPVDGFFEFLLQFWKREGAKELK